jgi:hypothetical protein
MKGTHHQLADVCAADEKRTKMGQIERIGGASVRARTDHGQRCMPCQVAHLSAELAWTAGGKYPLATQTIPWARNNASFDH